MGSEHPGLLRCSFRGGAVEVRWLGAPEHAAIRSLLELHEAFTGAPRRRLDERLLELRRDARHGTALPLIQHVLDRAYRGRTRSAIDPARVREAVFRAAAGGAARDDAFAAAARELRVSAAALESALLADLPGERLVAPPAAPLGLAEVVERANLSVAQALLRISTSVAVELEGNARAVVRHARLRGLICTVARPRGGAAVELRISGPLSLFRRTTLYGRELAELVPMLPWCRRFVLRARCERRGAEGSFELRSGDPIPAGPEPRLYDSALERRFARELTRLTADWELVREPEPVAAEGTLIFPDFALQHRWRPERRYLLEIAGFWTAGYVREKLRRLRAAGLQNLVLCIDADRGCDAEALPDSAHIVWYRRRLDAGAILRLVEELSSR